MKISEFPSAVIKENVDYTVKEITNVIKKYGPRESGNDACFDAEKHRKMSSAASQSFGKTSFTPWRYLFN